MKSNNNNNNNNTSNELRTENSTERPASRIHHPPLISLGFENTAGYVLSCRNTMFESCNNHGKEGIDYQDTGDEGIKQ